MTHEEICNVARQHGLGAVHFQFNVAKNTGHAFEVGYVLVAGHQELFCKRQSYSTEADFYLCNEFRKLQPTQYPNSY